MADSSRSTWSIRQQPFCQMLTRQKILRKMCDFLYTTPLPNDGGDSNGQSQ